MGVRTHGHCTVRPYTETRNPILSMTCQCLLCTKWSIVTAASVKQIFATNWREIKGPKSIYWKFGLGNPFNGEWIEPVADPPSPGGPGLCLRLLINARCWVFMKFTLARLHLIRLSHESQSWSVRILEANSSHDMLFRFMNKRYSFVAFGRMVGLYLKYLLHRRTCNVIKQPKEWPLISTIMILVTAFWTRLKLKGWRPHKLKVFSQPTSCLLLANWWHFNCCWDNHLQL